MAWEIAIPPLRLRLAARTAVEDQELYEAHSVSPTYWEGTVTYKGQMRDRPIQGVGYLEMMGYAREDRPILRAAPR